MFANIGTAFGVLALAGLGFGIGSAVAVPHKLTPVNPYLEYSINEEGHTFGIMGENEMPDLVGVYATNGRIGYVWAHELQQVAGHPSQFDSPEEAIDWQQRLGHQDHLIPVYESDGRTIIGEFLISGNE